MTATFDLSITRTIPASAKKLFDAWLDPAALTSFMCPGPGMTVSKAETDPKVGGAFLIVMKAGDAELPHHGAYTIVEPHRRLAFTWHGAHAGEGSVVTVTFEARGPNETELTLVHVGLASEQLRDNHRGGWTAILERCASATA